MRKLFIFLLACCFTGFSFKGNAQVKLDDVIGKVNDLLGKKQLLNVRKGFSPVFSLGNLQLNSTGILGEKLKGIKVLGTVFDSKGVEDIMKLYKTYKTGLVVYKVLAGAGTALTVYSTVRGITASNNFNDKTVKAILTPALTSVLTGVVTKILTKKASYKAVDIFNGVVKKKLKDILSVAPASSTLGLGVYVKL